MLIRLRKRFQNSKNRWIKFFFSSLFCLNAKHMCFAFVFNPQDLNISCISARKVRSDK